MTKDAQNFSSSFLRQIDIHSLLPQQEPFVMIGCLVYFDERRTITETTIKEDNIFVPITFHMLHNTLAMIALIIIKLTGIM